MIRSYYRSIAFPILASLGMLAFFIGVANWVSNYRSAENRKVTVPSSVEPEIDLFQNTHILERDDEPERYLAVLEDIRKVLPPHVGSLRPQATNYWLYYELPPSRQASGKIVRVRPESFAPIDVFLFEEDRLIGNATYGRGRATAQGEVAYFDPGGTFLVHSSPNAKRALLMRMHATNPPDWTTAKLLSPLQFAQADKARHWLSSIKMALDILLMLYGFYGFFLRLPGSLWHGVMYLGSAIFWGLTFGILQSVFSLNDPDDLLIRIAWSATAISLCLFIVHQFDTRQTMKYLHLVLMSVVLFQGTLILVMPWIDSRLYYQLVALPWMVYLLLSMIVGIRAWQLKLPGGITILVGWFIWFLIILPSFAQRFGFIPFQEWILLALVIGGTWQQAVFSWLLARAAISTWQEKIRIETRDRARLRFLAQVTHDLRQPVHALNLMVEQLQRSAEGVARQISSRVRQSIDHLSDMLTDLLDMTHIAGGTVQVLSGPVSLGAIFKKLEEELQPVADAKNLRLRFVPTKKWVKSDKNHLTRITRNLVVNGLNYTQTGGVLIGVRKAGNQLRLDVVDSGTGISGNAQARIFEEFSRGDNVHNIAGMGLGLSIVQALSRILKHKISLQSVEGKGTRIGIVMDQTDPSKDVEEEKQIPLVSFSGKRILIVDDDAVVRDATMHLIEAWGATVYAAGDQKQTEEMARQHPDLDAAIIDWSIGKDNGLVVLKNLEAILHKQLPSLIVTGDTSLDSFAACKAAGRAHMNKPLKALRLANELRRLLERKN